MEHVDAEVLALLALGEPASDADLAHVEECERCSEDLAELTAAVAAGRALSDDDALVPPAPHVWARISDELGLGSAGVAAGTVAGEAAGDVVGEAAGEVAGAVVAEGPAAPEVPLAPVLPLRRRRTGWLVAAAAAAGLVVGGVGVGVLRDGGGAAPEVLAEAALEPLPGWNASGDAKVEQGADGALTLVLTLDGAPDDNGFHEVWLIDRDVTRLISVGVLTGTEGRFTLPSGIDLADFPVVDVSEEAYDGNPAHSGDSIIRGILNA